MRICNFNASPSWGVGSLARERERERERDTSREKGSRWCGDVSCRKPLQPNLSHRITTTTNAIFSAVSLSVLSQRFTTEYRRKARHSQRAPGVSRRHPLPSSLRVLLTLQEHRQHHRPLSPTIFLLAQCPFSLDYTSYTSGASLW